MSTAPSLCDTDPLRSACDDRRVMLGSGHGARQLSSGRRVERVTHDHCAVAHPTTGASSVGPTVASVPQSVTCASQRAMRAPSWCGGLVRCQVTWHHQRRWLSTPGCAVGGQRRTALYARRVARLALHCSCVRSDLGKAADTGTVLALVVDAAPSLAGWWMGRPTAPVASSTPRRATAANGVMLERGVDACELSMVRVLRVSRVARARLARRRLLRTRHSTRSAGGWRWLRAGRHPTHSFINALTRRTRGQSAQQQSHYRAMAKRGSIVGALGEFALLVLVCTASSARVAQAQAASQAQPQPATIAAVLSRSALEVRSAALRCASPWWWAWWCSSCGQ